MNEEPKPLDFNAIDEQAANDFYHEPSEKFLVETDSGRWLSLSTASYKRILAVRGFSTKNGPTGVSDADLEIVRIQSEFDIVRYGPLCGKNPGFYEENGIRHLVTEPMRLIEPRQGSATIITAILRGLLASGEREEIGTTQLHTFLGWLQSSVQALRAGRYQQQQAIVFAGPRDCGKSLVQNLIITDCLAGRAADGEKYFLRNNDFNADLYKAEHVVIDDRGSSNRISNRLAFGQKLKGATVGSGVGDLHGKGRDGVALRPWWRVSITCNDQPENLLVLPPLNADVSDKLIMLRASRFDLPMPVETQEQKDTFSAAIKRELPAFLYFLLNLYELPEQYRDRRYGVATFHHPDLAEALDRLSPESELLELIDLTLGNELATGALWIKASDLEDRIRRSHGVRADRIFTYSQACGKYLQRLSVNHPERVQKNRRHCGDGWSIKSVGGVWGE